MSWFGSLAALMLRSTIFRPSRIIFADGLIGVTGAIVGHTVDVIAAPLAVMVPAARVQASAVGKSRQREPNPVEAT